MSVPIPKIYEGLTQQERLEADYNLVGLFKILLKVDQRIKKQNNLMKGSQNDKSNGSREIPRGTTKEL